MSWTETTLGEVAKRDKGLIQTGPFGSQLHQSDYQPEGTPVIMPKDIIEGGVSEKSVARVSGETVNRLKRHRLAPKAIVLPRRGEITKRAFITPEQQGWLCGTGCLKIELSGTELTPEYLYYFMAQDSVVQWLAQHAVGTTMLNLSAAIVEQLPLRYPSVPVQIEIASVLSAYDHLMENNRRRMLLLEDAAQLIYEEWFVHFRFPGYQRTEETVEKWTPFTLDDLCSIGRGASPRPIAQFMEGEIPWFKIGDATASEGPYVFVTAEHVTDEGAKKSVVLQPRSLILSNSATCGIPFFTAVRGCIHDGWLHFAGLKRISPEFLYCYLKNKRNEVVSSVSDGSTQKNLNTSAVGRLRLLLPLTNSLLTEFDNIVQPLFSMIFNLARQNISLRTARDLLLPRLMTGEIPVNSKLDKF